MSDGGWQGINGPIEIIPSDDMGEGLRDILQRIIEISGGNEMAEGGRQLVAWFVPMFECQTVDIGWKSC